MYVMGIDSGSTSTNAVIMDTDKKIIASTVVRTEPNRQTARPAPLRKSSERPDFRGATFHI